MDTSHGNRSNVLQRSYSKKYLDRIKSEPEAYEEYKEKRNDQQRLRRCLNKPSSIGRGCYSKKYSEALKNTRKTRNATKKLHEYKEKRSKQQQKRRGETQPQSIGRGKYSKKYEQKLKRDPKKFREYKTKRSKDQKSRRYEKRLSNNGREKCNKKDKPKSTDEYRNKRREQQKKRRAKVVELMREKQSNWPCIPSQKIKQRCVREYREAFSFRALKLTVCCVCGEEHLGTTNMKSLDFSKIPHPEILKTSEDRFRRFVHHGLMIEQKGISSRGKFNICNKCYNMLDSGTLPSCSIKNIPLGDQPQCFQILTLPEKVLISMYRMKVILLKLQPFKSGSHIAIRGNSITFPQNISSITKKIVEFPVNVKELSDAIKIVFIGSMKPSKKTSQTYLDGKATSGYRCTSILAKASLYVQRH